MFECNAYCCRKGFLEVTEKELDLLVGSKREQFLKDAYVHPLGNDNFSLNLGNDSGGCPSLSGSKCSVHKNPARPATCDKYPVFVNEKKKEIRLSTRCFAVKANLFYAFKREAELMGYTFNEL